MIQEEFWWVTRLFDRVYGTPPATTRYVRGSLPLLDGLDVPLPWGAVVAAARSDDGTTSLFSMNHHGHGVVRPPTAPDWARDCLKAVNAHPTPGAHLMVNRELPTAMGLLTGAETTEATTQALQDLYGDVAATAPPARRSCDLSAAGLRLLLADVGSRPPPPLPPLHATGEHPPPTTATTWQHPHLTLFKGYGTTDTTIGVIMGQLHPTHTTNPPPIGTPLANNTALILDRHLN
ncbi:hypothetical protein ACH34T_30695, partial [Actinomadura sp. 9N215]